VRCKMDVVGPGNYQRAVNPIGPGVRGEKEGGGKDLADGRPADVSDRQVSASARCTWRRRSVNTV
jgi:hypothetical protein